MVQAQTHVYVMLYNVAIHTKGIIYSRQCCFKLSSWLLWSSVLSAVKARISMHKVKESRDVEYLDVTFDPKASVHVASHAQ